MSIVPFADAHYNKIAVDAWLRFGKAAIQPRWTSVIASRMPLGGHDATLALHRRRLHQDRPGARSRRRPGVVMNLS
jgi:hypothetical protein